MLISNHQSFLDPLAVGISSTRPLIYLARKTLFKNPVFGKLLTSFRTYPIDQEGFARGGLETILRQLKLGQPVLVFPEGERTQSGKMGPLRSGIHLLIKRVPMQVVPVGIAGAYEAWPRWRPFPRFAPLFWPHGDCRIAVSIGKPIDTSTLLALTREQVIELLAVRIKECQLRAEKIRTRKNIAMRLPWWPGIPTV